MGRDACSRAARSTPTAAAATPPTTPTARPARRGPPRPPRYTGVQDYNDYFEGLDPDFYDPNDPRGAFSAWPRYPGLMDRAESPVPGRGPRRALLRRRSATTTDSSRATPAQPRLRGRRDRLPEGDRARPAVHEPSERDRASDASLLSTSCAARPHEGRARAARSASPVRQHRAVQGAPRTALREPGRRSRVRFRGPAGARGFERRRRLLRVEPASPGLRFIALNTVGEGGVVSDRSSDGNIDDPQFRWLEQRAPGRDRPQRADRAVRAPRDQQPHQQRAGRVGATVHRHRRRPRARPEPRLRPRPARSRPRCISASRASGPPATRPRRFPSCCCATRT